MFFSKKKATAAALVCSGCFQAAVAASETNEYLELDLSQLMNITVTSVAKKEQSFFGRGRRCSSSPGRNIRRTGVTTIADALAMAPAISWQDQLLQMIGVLAGFAGYTSNLEWRLMRG
jgi:iron complex outermembrane receptor protein